jgi:cell shape-determining protein MreC
MNLVKIKDSEFVRDMTTNAVLNVNQKAILEFNEQRNKILREKQEKEETKLRLAKMEQDMQEIKQLLKEITDLRLNNGN